MSSVPCTRPLCLSAVVTAITSLDNLEKQTTSYLDCQEKGQPGVVTSFNRRPPAWLTGAFVFATISGTVRHRRQLTISRAASRATADEVHKSIELETRV